MQLFRLCDVVPDGSGHVYRQGRVMGVINVLVLGGVLIAAPFLWYFLRAPWPIWSICAALAVLVVPMLVGDLRARMRDTNWVLWLRPDGAWVNFRSYQDTSATDARCIVKFDYREIAQARKHVQRYTMPSQGHRTTSYVMHSLELTLAHADTAALEQAMADDRRREPPQRFYFGVGVTSRPTHFPVRLAEPNCLRMAWRGGVGTWIAPSLGHVLRELAGYVRTGDAVAERRTDWRDLNDDELDDRILELAQAGDTIDAVKLLTARRGYTTTEAKRFLDGVMTTV